MSTASPRELRLYALSSSATSNLAGPMKKLRFVCCPQRREAGTRVISTTALLLLCFSAPVAWGQSSASDPPELDIEGLKDLARAPPEASSMTPPGGLAQVERSFRLTLPFDANATRSSAPTVANYDAVEHTLTLTFRPIGAAEGSGIELEHVTRPGRRLSVANGTSPVALVQAYRARKLDAEFVAMPPAGANVEQEYALTVNHVSADEAARLRGSAEVVLRGRVAAFDTAGPSRCSIQTERLYAPAPSLTNLVTCAVALSLEQITIVAPERQAERSWPPRRLEAEVLAPVVRREDLVELIPSVAELSLDREDDRNKSVSEPLQAPTVMEAPTWLTLPTSEMVERVYPLKAYATGLGGDVTLNCLELQDGRVADCRVLHENPPGAGFGHAAVTLSRSFRFSPTVQAGTPIRARIQIPYTFSVVDDNSDDRQRAPARH